MFGIENFAAFLTAGILLNLTPGNDTIFILSRSVAQGRRAGILSVLGISAGSVVHTLLAAFGLSLVVARSAVLFSAVKWAGAAYLAWMGWQMLTQKSALNFEAQRGETSADSDLKIFRDALLTNVLNPKVALFFIAFLPQFVKPTHTGEVLPFLLLGLTFICTGTIWCLVLALFAARISERFRQNPRMAAGLNKICGAALLGLAVRLAGVERG